MCSDPFPGPVSLTTQPTLSLPLRTAAETVGKRSTCATDEHSAAPRRRGGECGGRCRRLALGRRSRCRRPRWHTFAAGRRRPAGPDSWPPPPPGGSTGFDGRAGLPVGIFQHLLKPPFNLLSSSILSRVPSSLQTFSKLLHAHPRPPPILSQTRGVFLEQVGGAQFWLRNFNK